MVKRKVITKKAPKSMTDMDYSKVALVIGEEIGMDQIKPLFKVNVTLETIPQLISWLNEIEKSLKGDK